MKKIIIALFMIPFVLFGTPQNIQKEGGDLTGNFNLPTGKKITYTTDAGAQTIWVPAIALTPATTNGAAAVQVELTAGRPEIAALEFDPTTAQFAQFAVAMPKNWDLGTVKAQFYWAHPSTTTNFGVVWTVAGVAISDDDTIDVAYGTAQSVTDTGGTTNDLYVSAFTSAVTIAGTPAAGDIVYFHIARDPAAGGDTMAVNARLIGMKLIYNTTSTSDQ